MSSDFAHYRQLEARLWLARWINEGRESPEEDAILDEMENTWLQLTDDQRTLLRQEPPMCWPASDLLPPQVIGGRAAVAPASWTYEGFDSPLDAILDAEAA